MTWSWWTQAREELRQPHTRLVAGAAAGFLLDAAYALYHGVLCVWSGSAWFGVMCAYYAMLALMRLGALGWGHRRPEEAYGSAVRLTGMMLALWSVVLAAMNYISLEQNLTKGHGTIVMITIATYTFTKITLAAVRAVRTRRDTSGSRRCIRAIGYAEVAASVLTMQKAMLVSFGDMEGRQTVIFNAATGAAVCLFVLALGLRLLLPPKGERK